MLRLNYKYFLLSLFLFPVMSFATEALPDDIRYMLEDMYGANKAVWPLIRNVKDINNDGFPDWVIQKNACKNNSCSAELFICVPNNKGTCSEYCYMEVKSLVDIEEQIKHRKCESTC